MDFLLGALKRGQIAPENSSCRVRAYFVYVCGDSFVSPQGCQPAAAVPTCAYAPSHKDQALFKANPSHLLMSCHAVALATLESVWAGDFSQLEDKATANAQAVTPVGAVMLRQHVFAKSD